jgi:hypothetical protein
MYCVLDVGVFRDNLSDQVPIGYIALIKDAMLRKDTRATQ